MTAADLAATFAADGWATYPTTKDAIAMEGPSIGGPACDCNDRPPSLHVQIWHDSRSGDYGPGVTFAVFGKAGGEWLMSEVYSVKRADAFAYRRRAGAIAGAVWAAFVREATR